MIPPLPGADQSVLDWATHRDMRHELTMLRAVVLAAAKTTKGIPKAKRQQLIADLNDELARLADD